MLLFLFCAAGTLEREVKFEAQLYKMRDGEYSLDFQVGCCSSISL